MNSFINNGWTIGIGTGIIVLIVSLIVTRLFFIMLRKKPLNLTTLTNYINTSKQVNKYATHIESLGVSVTPSGAFDRTARMLQDAGYTSIGQVNRMMKKSSKWGKDYINNLYDGFRDGHGGQMPSATDRQGILDMFLIANHPEVFNQNLLFNNYGYGNSSHIFGDAASKARSRASS